MTAIAPMPLKRPLCQTIAIFTLAFWLSSSLVLDLVIMPSLYVSGMMTEAGFAPTAYLIFWLFNRIELICAALVLTVLLVLRNLPNPALRLGGKAILLSVILLVVALVDTYGLTPQMSALGMQLNLFEVATTTPAGMNQLHQSYWILELIKVTIAGIILGWCYNNYTANNWSKKVQTGSQAS